MYSNQNDTGENKIWMKDAKSTLVPNLVDELRETKGASKAQE